MRINWPLIRRIATMAILAALAACAAPDRYPGPPQPTPARKAPDRPIAKPSRPEPREMNRLYRRGEQLYAGGNFSEAAKNYLRFIAESTPSDPMVDNAYFKVGMSWFEMGRYRDAKRYFSAITSRFPHSEMYKEAVINTAICRYYLNELEAAEKAFLRAATLVGDPGQKAYIHYYQANIAERRSRFLDAVDLYVRAERLAGDKSLVDAARHRTGRIFHNFLSEKDLVTLTRRFSGQWPAQMALEELIRIYRQTGDKKRLDQVRKQFAQQFPPSRRAGLRPVIPVGDDTYRPRTITIGAVLPLSGDGASAGREIIQGIQLAFNSFHSLVTSKRIQLIIKDSGGGSAVADEALEMFAKERDTILIIGPAFSEEFERAATTSQRYRIPMLSPSATAEGAAGLSDYLFRNTVTTSLEAEKLAELAVTKLGLHKFAILYADDTYGRELNRFFTETVQRLGATVVTAEPYHPDQTDFGEQIRLIGGITDDTLRKEILAVSRSDPEAWPHQINATLQKRYLGALATPQIITYGTLPLNTKNFLPGLSLKYDAIFLAGLYDKLGLILPELEFYNIKGIVKLAGKGAHHPDLIAIAERYSEGLIFLDGFYKNSDSAHVKGFVRDYHLYFHEEPTILSAQGYDAARMALSAIAHGAVSRREMTSYLAALQFFEGVSGVTSMKPSGDADKSVFFLTVKQGEIVEYAPPEKPGTRVKGD